MDIAVIGAGYVGLVTSACFAELGNHVTCIDIDSQKILDLQQGILPIYEPGLDALIANNRASKRLFFSESLETLPRHPHIIFIAVGTPNDKEGVMDMQYVLNAARSIGRYLHQYCVIVDKSTVPVGVTEQLSTVIQDELSQYGKSILFDVVSNPEFLREGAAINDFMHPERIIVGLASQSVQTIMMELYKPIMRNPEKIYFMSIKEAEMTKYAANAMLATKISFMNEIALLCERMGVDVDHVRLGLGSDSRIGDAFIYPGCGYGGSCFPKDIQALIHMAEQYQLNPFILRAVSERNYHQQRVLADKIKLHFGQDLSDLTFGIWGLSFKPDTDDLREASAVVLLDNLLACNANIQVYDPVAIPAAKRTLPEAWLKSGRLHFMENQYAALNNADALALVTEWKPFCYPDLQSMKKLMRQHVIFDGRNQYDPKQVRREQFVYYGIGRI